MFRYVFYSKLYTGMCVFSASTWLNDVKQSLPFTPKKKRCSSIVFWGDSAIVEMKWNEQIHCIWGLVMLDGMNLCLGPFRINVNFWCRESLNPSPWVPWAQLISANPKHSDPNKKRQLASLFLWQDLYFTTLSLKCPDFLWFKQSARVLSPCFVAEIVVCLAGNLRCFCWNHPLFQEWISPCWWFNIFVNPNMRKILEVMACVTFFQGNDANQTKSQRNTWSILKFYGHVQTSKQKITQKIHVFYLSQNHPTESGRKIPYCSSPLNHPQVHMKIHENPMKIPWQFLKNG